MHIPGHVLDPATSISTGLAATAAVGYSLYRLRNESPGHQTTSHQPPGHPIPGHQTPVSPSLIGVVAACIFAVQMLNFPLPGGTSGHLLGGVLAGIVLGPWAGIVAMTAVLVVQCLLFGDGGATALGANVLNMAVTGSALGYTIYYSVNRSLEGARGRLMGAALAAWTSVMVGATLCSIELSLGGQYALKPTLAAMLPAHALVGLAEAMITTVAVAYVLSVRAVSVNFGAVRGDERIFRRLLFPGLAAALIMAVLGSPFASALPDVLEATVRALAPSQKPATTAVWTGWANYDSSGVHWLAVTGPFASAAGTLAAFLAAVGIARSCLGSEPFLSH